MIPASAGRDDLAFQWQRCTAHDCQDIDGATFDRVQLTTDDAGARLRVELTATTGSGSGRATSDETVTIADTDGSATGQLVYLSEDRKTLYRSDKDGSARCPDSCASGR